MSDQREAAIRLEGVGKMYKIFASRGANLKDALGLPSMHNERFTEFWAVRGIDFELFPGERLGIIGRNGAGKSTILKLITENISPSEGTVEVHGQVQALLDTGGGLHPEFTGEENIEAALTFLGLSRTEIAAARGDIAEFTELGRFLSQPFKTYSLGMQARLAFAIATTIRPEILIIDEVLGAGDAYFFAKSAARMRDLLDSGAAVILVSHALDQITRFCDKTIWLDRGRVVMRGETVDVVKRYEKFIRELDDRRLRAKNRKTRLQTYDGFERDSYTDHFTVSFAATHALEIAEIELVQDDDVEDEISVGSPQDAGTSQSSYIILDGSNWSPPRADGDAYFRSVEPEAGGGRTDATAQAIFYAWFIYPDSKYAVDVRYRLREGVGRVGFGRSGRIDVVQPLEPADDWTTARIVLREPEEEPPIGQVERSSPEQGEQRAQTVRRLSRWEGIGTLAMEDVSLLDRDDNEQTTFAVGEPMAVAFQVVAAKQGQYPVVFAVLIFRLDGIVVTRHVSEEVVLDVEQDERVQARLDLGPLQLGNGTYVVSLGLYRTIDIEDIEPSEFYDYFDKSYEFKVVGNPPLHNELVRHPGEWTVAGTPAHGLGARENTASSL